jgi:hypothetical protein
MYIAEHGHRILREKLIISQLVRKFPVVKYIVLTINFVYLSYFILLCVKTLESLL